VGESEGDESSAPSSTVAVSPFSKSESSWLFGGLLVHSLSHQAGPTSQHCGPRGRDGGSELGRAAVLLRGGETAARLALDTLVAHASHE